MAKTPKKAAPRKGAKAETEGDLIAEALADFGDPSELARAVAAGAAPAGARYTIARPKLGPGAFPVPQLAGGDVAAVRAALGLPQTTFAAFLGVAVQTVQAWEQERTPVPGIAARWLGEVRGDLDYWKRKITATAG